jgi:HEAT repeat protein
VGIVLWAVVSFGREPEATDRTPLPAKQEKESLPAIVFVGAPIFDEKTDGGVGVYQGAYHWRDSYIYARSSTYNKQERTMGPVRPGRNLYALVPARPDGKLTRLTHLKSGAVFKPEPSFDGKKVLFAMRRDDEDWFHQYEINVDGTGLKQLTDGPFNDFAGTYLPDGRIVFCSDRTGYLEEYHEERTETLFVMNGDGTGIEQITFCPGTYFEPSVLKDGRILFSFWDAFHIDVPPFDKHETVLMTVNPDGTEERHLFGSGQYRFFNRERHSGVGLTQAREMQDGRILLQSEMGPAILDLRAGLPARDALAPVFPGTTSIQLGGTTHRSHLSPLGTRSTPHPLQDGRFLFSATEPGARDSAIYVCEPETRTEQLIYNIPNYAEFDAVPVLMERPKPAILPSLKTQNTKIKNQTKNNSQTTSLEPAMAKFMVVTGRITDNPERTKALKQARFFRVIEAEYTGVTTSSHTNLETRILGVAPIMPDGSAYFEAPADTPIFLDPLDAGGNRVLFKWNYPNTSVKEGTYYPTTQMTYMVGRPGETRSCYGCHAHQGDAVPNASVMAVKHGPVKITRESTDIQYRRNDPEGYRRQARIGDGAKYISWLTNKDPVRRARACEMLMHLEDEAGPAVPKIASLLKDDSVEVRRTAGLAMTRLATHKEALALEKALEDADWQVQFFAAAALEAIGKNYGKFPGSAYRGLTHFTLSDLTVLFGPWTPQEQLCLWTLMGLRKMEKTTPLLGEESPKAKLFTIGPVNTWQDDWSFETLGRMPANGKILAKIRSELAKPQPDVLAIRAAGKLKDKDSVKLLIPWLKKHEQEYHAAEAALALGRIGTPEAIAALWAALRSEVPIKQVHISRYLQHGPRPEEYALIKALLIARAQLSLEDIYLLIALLPNTFTEKPRFEDRLREESQRVLMPRVFLERGGFRRRAVDILRAALKNQQQTNDPVYAQLLKGINLERPFSEHGRPFNVIKSIGAEEALWLLGCLLEPDMDLKTAKERQELEALVAPCLTSKDYESPKGPRERIDAAVLLGRIGFGPKTADILAGQIARPYPFPEIASIGKGMPDFRHRDKAYFVQTLAMHIDDVGKLKPFADPKKMYRDIRYGLTHGLARRGKADGIPLLMEMATRDPITLIRQQARYALADIQDAYRLAGKPVPEVTMPEALPLEAHYPPRGLKWSDTTFREFDLVPLQPPKELNALSQYLKTCLDPSHFRNLNMAQAQGAERMMIVRIEETRQGFASLAKHSEKTASASLLAALDSPYPYVHYLAAKALAERGERSAIPVLIKKLEFASKTRDTVGFWWYCEALGQLRAKEALPALAKYVTTVNPPGTFGPEGMPAGYIAARALARIVGDCKQSDVARLLKEENVWLRAGAMRGLAESKSPGIEALLEQAADEDSPALVRSEARVQLKRLGK